MNKKTYYRALFLIGAIWNWTIAPVFFFFYEPIIKATGLDPLRYGLPLQLAMALVFVYGICYYYVFKDPVGNRVCAKLGIFSKTLVFLVLFYNWITGVIVFGLLVPGIVDLIFAGFYIEFLYGYKAVQTD